METGPSSPKATETVLFRPTKKRKIYRQRTLDDVPSPTSSLTDVTETSSNPMPAPAIMGNGSPMDGEPEGTGVSIYEIQRLRKLRKHRVGGVEFRASTTNARGDDRHGDTLVLCMDSSRAAGEKKELPQEAGVVRRFAKQTGMVGDVDKHMIAYIDSELAKRRLNAIPLVSATEDAEDRPQIQDSSSTGTVKASKPIERQPAALGKLLEIDLGNEARYKNVVRTEQARRRLDGGEVEDESPPEGSKKPRLGRDGKPWRERKRRTSEDIRRDKLVEEVLRENRLEMYEEPPPPIVATSGDGEADDRIAEAFRREFMDAVSQRQRRKAAPASTARGSGGKKEEEVLKGPKLGGSRSARAAMREAQLKDMKAGKK